MKNKTEKNYRKNFNFFKKKTNARVRFLQVVFASEYQDNKSIDNKFTENLLLDKCFESFHDYDIDYFEKLISFFSKNKKDLDYYLSNILDRDIKSIGFIEINILRLACIELSSTFLLHSKVAANEAIELAKKFGAKDSFKFINGVLFEIIKNPPMHF